MLKTVLLDFETPENMARYEVHISLEKHRKNIFSRFSAVTCVGQSAALKSCELRFNNIASLSCPRSRKIVTLKSFLFISSFPSGWDLRRTQRECISKPLKHSIVERILVFKR